MSIIESQFSGKVCTVNSSDQIVQWTYSGKPSQHWDIKYIQGKMIFYSKEKTNWCITVPEVGKDLYLCLRPRDSSNDRQLFRYENDFIYTPKDTRRVFDVCSESRSNGGRLIYWGTNNNLNQKWSIEKTHLATMLEKNAADQKDEMAKLKADAKKELEDAKQFHRDEEEKRKKLAKEKMDDLKEEMEAKQKEQQLEMEEKLATISEKNQEERKKLLEEQKEHQRKFQQNLKALEENLAEKEKIHAQKMEEMMKVVEKKNYESHYPVPEALKEHIRDNPKAFNIQVLGCRGAGKSTFVNNVLKKAGLKKQAAIGNIETTKVTAFYDITDKIKNKPDRYNKIFLCDQPGIGGLEITEAGYLAKFGPGHFNATFMLGEKGFNELDMALLKHLVHNKKSVAFVRTQCDSAINGMKDAYEEEDDGDELSHAEALEMLQTEVSKYMNEEVLSQVGLESEQMEIFYCGVPTKNFPDFKRLADYILNGSLLHTVAKLEAVDIDQKPSVTPSAIKKEEP